MCVSLGFVSALVGFCFYRVLARPGAGGPGREPPDTAHRDVGAGR